MGSGAGSGVGISAVAVSAAAERILPIERGAAGCPTAVHHRGRTAAHQRGGIYWRRNSTGDLTILTIYFSSFLLRIEIGQSSIYFLSGMYRYIFGYYYLN